MNAITVIHNKTEVKIDYFFKKSQSLFILT